MTGTEALTMQFIVSESTEFNTNTIHMRPRGNYKPHRYCYLTKHINATLLMTLSKKRSVQNI